MMNMGRRVVLVAHRGDPKNAPENSLASFRSAIARGAKTVEMDVRRSADRKWIAFHDHTLRRMTGKPGWVARTSAARLRSLEVGDGERIPFVHEVLALCRRKHVGLFLDVKDSDDEGGLLDNIKEFMRYDNISIGGGTVASLRRWRRLLKRSSPALFWVTGTHTGLTPQRIFLARRLQLAGFVAYKKQVTKEVIQRVQSSGLKLYVWTIRTPRELRRFARWGVDGIMSEVWPPPSIS